MSDPTAQPVAPPPGAPFAMPTEPAVLPTPQAPSAYFAPPAPPFDPPQLVPPLYTPPRRRSRGWVVAVVLLAVALVGAIGVGVWIVLQLDQAVGVIRDQQRELEEQRELIDKKEQFGQAMEHLIEGTTAYEGVLFATVVPWDDYERLAISAWAHRWDADELDRHIADAHEAAAALEARLAEAAQEASVNTSGTTSEAVLDMLGAGFVTTRVGDADTLCEDDVLGCVISNEPRVVHIDAADYDLPYMTDWLRTGVAYHEFAHVLQLTNPEPTSIALEAFDGDDETMADCFALTYLDGWTLDHRVWVSGYSYWDVSIGYGYTCTDSQRQVIRDWYAKLGVTSRVIGA